MTRGKWQEVEITFNRTAVEGVYGVLEQRGIQNYAVEDSALIDQARDLGWGDYFPELDPSDLITITCYFSEKLTQEELEQIKDDILALKKYGFDPGPVDLRDGQVDEADWAKAWKAYYHPIRIGQVLIQPSWESEQSIDSATKVVVNLDPGMAFGSGTHPTTSMCVEFLQGLNLEERVLWDVGTGSGILAIVAAKLGARVEAVDIDPVAVKVARENRDLNELDFAIKEGTLSDLTGRPQIIVANIVAHVIGPMLPDVYATLEPGGFFIAAGVIQDRDPEILSLAQQAGLRLLRRVQQGEWVGYLFQRGE